MTFGPGAEVLCIKLNSDLKTLQIQGLRREVIPAEIKDILSTAGIVVSLDNLRARSISDTVIVIEISVPDTEAGEQLSVPIVSGLLRKPHPSASVCITSSANSTGPTSNRLQLNTVICSWYLPSRVAWLHYHSSKWANLAAERFTSGKKCRGREVSSRVTSTPDLFVRRSIWSVELGNLDVDTDEEDLNRFLKGIVPDKILFGKASYTASKEHACELVRSQLAKHGPLQSWDVTETQGTTRMKAVARFENFFDAKAAVTALSGNKIAAFGNSKLFLSNIISIKFLVLYDLFHTIRADLDKLKNELRDDANVLIHVYLPEQRGKAVTVRISGEHAKAVAKAKIAFENLIQGSAVTDEAGAIIWDRFFTSTPGLNYLR